MVYSEVLQYLTGTPTAPLLLNDIIDSIQSCFDTRFIIVFKAAKCLLRKKKKSR